jgi:hypothetical protein
MASSEWFSRWLLVGACLAACGDDAAAPGLNMEMFPGTGIDAGVDSDASLPPSGDGDFVPPGQVGGDGDGDGPVQVDAGDGDGDAVDGATPEPSESDAGATGDASEPTAPGTCGGTTPHGCYTPHADNPAGCGAQIFEQSAFYPPLEEWMGCGTVQAYQTCNYDTPDGKVANCVCDTGLHWLCTYP